VLQYALEHGCPVEADEDDEDSEVDENDEEADDDVDEEEGVVGIV